MDFKKRNKRFPIRQSFKAFALLIDLRMFILSAIMLINFMSQAQNATLSRAPLPHKANRAMKTDYNVYDVIKSLIRKVMMSTSNQEETDGSQNVPEC